MGNPGPPVGSSLRTPWWSQHAVVLRPHKRRDGAAMGACMTLKPSDAQEDVGSAASHPEETGLGAWPPYLSHGSQAHQSHESQRQCGRLGDRWRNCVDAKTDPIAAVIVIIGTRGTNKAKAIWNAEKEVCGTRRSNKRLQLSSTGVKALAKLRGKGQKVNAEPSRGKVQGRWCWTVTGNGVAKEDSNQRPLRTSIPTDAIECCQIATTHTIPAGAQKWGPKTVKKAHSTNCGINHAYNISSGHGDERGRGFLDRCRCRASMYG